MSKRIWIFAAALFAILLLNVNDRPVVSNLDDYYTLITKGKVTIMLCDEETDIFWQDFSPSDRKLLQHMLRTP